MRHDPAGCKFEDWEQPGRYTAEVCQFAERKNVLDPVVRQRKRTVCAVPMSVRVDPVLARHPRN